MPILVIGGTGTVGSLVAAELSARGEAVKVLTRSAEKAGSLPVGIEGVVGNLADPPSLLRVFEGIDRVMLITGVHPDESAHGQNAIRAARKAGVKKVVYMSVVLPPDSLHIPHFASKLPIEKAVKESGCAWTILRPNNFFQNDLWYRDVMLEHGLYPQPLGSAGVARVDTRDIAACAVNALSGSSLEGKTISLSGPTLLTGKDVAKIWSRHLGSEVNYMGDDLTQWAESAAGSLPPWMVHDFRIMYDYFQKRGLKSSPIEMKEMETALGCPPRDFDRFASETAASWREEGSKRSQ